VRVALSGGPQRFLVAMARPSEVIVIGAGVIGCSVAYELARRGASVEVVDERAIGMGATHASAGILAPYVESREGSSLLDLTARSLDLFDEFIARVSSDSGLAVSYRRTGTLHVATDEAQMRELALTAEAVTRRGVAAELVNGHGARLNEPHLMSGVVGGLIIGLHGFVAAFELTRAVAAAAQRHGAQLVQPSRVRRIGCVDGDMTVETDRGSLQGDAVVLAAGSWSGSVEIEGVKARVPVRPVRGQLLHLAWSGTPLRRILWGPNCYLVPWDDGTVLVGATTEEVGFDERATVAGVRDLLDAACQIIPHAGTAGFSGARFGFRPGTSDDLPVIGPSRTMPKLVYATGHYRNGVLLAPLTAQLVADALLDDRVDRALAAVSPARFGDL
jgi:glycine oxidase